jgi:hypothetical protein
MGAVLVMSPVLWHASQTCHLADPSASRVAMKPCPEHAWQRRCGATSTMRWTLALGAKVSQVCQCRKDGHPSCQIAGRMRRTKKDRKLLDFNG